MRHYILSTSPVVGDIVGVFTDREEACLAAWRQFHKEPDLGCPLLVSHSEEEGAWTVEWMTEVRDPSAPPLFDPDPEDEGEVSHSCRARCW